MPSSIIAHIVHYLEHWDEEEGPRRRLSTTAVSNREGRTTTGNTTMAEWARGDDGGRRERAVRYINGGSYVSKQTLENTVA